MLTNSVWGLVVVNWQWDCAGKVRDIQGKNPPGGLVTPILSDALNPQQLCDLSGCCWVFAFGPCWLDDH